MVALLVVRTPEFLHPRGLEFHVLVCSCEHKFRSDAQDAEGRGSSRRFSARNLLEFAVALRLRALGIPASVCGAVVYVLRGFERAMGRQMRGFRLPGNLLAANAPELKMIVGDDQRLYFTLGVGDSGAKTYGGVPLHNLLESDSYERKRLRGLGNQVKEGVLRAKVEVSVTGIAQDLRFGA